MKIIEFDNVCQGKNYEREYDVVVGVKYGDKGIIPCIKGSSRTCVGPNKDNICRSFFGYDIVEKDDDTIFLVRCDKIDCLKK